jgi:hypothetical protein
MWRREVRPEQCLYFLPSWQVSNCQQQRLVHQLSGWQVDWRWFIRLDLFQLCGWQMDRGWFVMQKL